MAWLKISAITHSFPVSSSRLFHGTLLAILILFLLFHWFQCICLFTTCLLACLAPFKWVIWCRLSLVASCKSMFWFYSLNYLPVSRICTSPAQSHTEYWDSWLSQTLANFMTSSITSSLCQLAIQWLTKWGIDNQVCRTLLALLLWLRQNRRLAGDYTDTRSKEWNEQRSIAMVFLAVKFLLHNVMFKVIFHTCCETAEHSQYISDVYPSALKLG